MDDLYICPIPGKTFSDESAMALVGFVFAAQEAGFVKITWLERGGDAALVHERLELFDVQVPVAAFPVGFEKFRGRGQVWQVSVFAAVGKFI